MDAWGFSDYTEFVPIYTAVTYDSAATDAQKEAAMASFGYDQDKDTCPDGKSCVFATTDEGETLFRCQHCNVQATYESIWDGAGSGSAVAAEIANKNRIEYGVGDEGLGFNCAQRVEPEEGKKDLAKFITYSAGSAALILFSMI